MTITQPLGLYDGLPKPEEQSRIDVNASPVDIVKSIYNLWLPIAKRYESTQSTASNILNIDLDSVYDETSKFISPYAKKFDKINNNQLKAIMEEVHDEKSSLSGIYLSALLNESNLKELDGIFNYKILGYKLKEGKKIIVRKNSEVNILGFYAKGEIINYSFISNFGNYSSGKMINFGHAYTMSDEITDGIHINFKDVVNRKTTDFFKGIFLNLGYINFLIANGGENGFEVNYGNFIPDSINSGQDRLNSKREFLDFRFSGPEINIGTISIMQSNKHDIIDVNNLNEEKEFQLFFRDNSNYSPINYTKIKKISPIVITLESKLRDFDHIKDLKDSPDEALKAIEAYDWNNFKEEVLGLKNDIEEILR